MAAEQESLEQLKEEVEGFIRSACQPLLADGERPPLDLSCHDWRLSFQFSKLLLEVWNPAQSHVWRVDGISHRDAGRLGLLVHSPGAHRLENIELREASSKPVLSRNEARSTFRDDLLKYLRARFPEWRFERVSNRSDRERSFSAWYTRGLAKLGRTGWAFLALGNSESPAAADAALAHGLNWLDWLRKAEQSCIVSGLKLFLPEWAVALTANRAAYLDAKLLQIEIIEWPSATNGWRAFDLADFGNVETHLAPRRQAETRLERHQEYLRSIFGPMRDGLDVVPDTAGDALSIRVLGLEIARLQGDALPRLVWGLEGDRHNYTYDRKQDLQDFVRTAIKTRAPGSQDMSHLFYRLQPERWLESLLIRDVSQLDPSLRADCVYPQVPAFSGGDRGVVDILSVLRDGRLAVIELKLNEEITLPMQGLDYWLRVKWLNDRRQFQEFGYFQNAELADAPPVLYLVSPAFRFHSTTRSIINYFNPTVEVVQVGINQTWRRGVKVLFRRAVHP